jgi:hypothetical protein
MLIQYYLMVESCGAIHHTVSVFLNCKDEYFVLWLIPVSDLSHNTWLRSDTGIPADNF